VSYERGTPVGDAMKVRAVRERHSALRSTLLTCTWQPQGRAFCCERGTPIFQGLLFSLSVIVQGALFLGLPQFTVEGRGFR